MKIGGIRDTGGDLSWSERAEGGIGAFKGDIVGKLARETWMVKDVVTNNRGSRGE